MHCTNREKTKILFACLGSSNWGTYSEEQYFKKDVSNPSNPDFKEFLNMVKSINGQKNVTHNFTHLLEDNKSLI